MNVDELAKRIRRLEHLLLGAHPPDVVAPNYITQDAQGRVGAQFSGKVQAAGVDLVAPAAGAAQPPNEIRWLRQSDGAVMADLVASDDGQLFLDALQDIWLRAANGSPSVHLQTDALGGPNAVFANVPGSSVTVLADGGVSRFLQLAAGDELAAIAFGSQVLNFANSNFSNVALVGHNIGRVPEVQLTPHLVAIQPDLSARDANTFQFQASSDAVLNQNVTVSWLAIG